MISSTTQRAPVQEDDGSQGFSKCRICEGPNDFVRLKLWPCKNKDCSEFGKRSETICNQCIRSLQFAHVDCIFCNTSLLQINEFGHYRNPAIQQFDIGILTSKFIDVKSFTTDPKTGKKALKYQIFKTLPTIAFQIIHLAGATNGTSQPADSNASLHLMGDIAGLENVLKDEYNLSKTIPQTMQENQFSEYLMGQMYNTNQLQMTRCGTNQILLTGGYLKDLDFIKKPFPSFNNPKKQHTFSDVLGLWRQAQTMGSASENTEEWKQLINSIQDIICSYHAALSMRMQVAQDNQIPMLPLSYPYQTTNYILDLTTSVSGQTFMLNVFDPLSAGRANHQTIVTKNKIFVLGGICNGFVLNSIECCDITRGPSSNIIGSGPFQPIEAKMIRPRCNFSAVLKPGVKCISTNCTYPKSDPTNFNCDKPDCHNHEFIYYIGGQSEYGKCLEEPFLERLNTNKLVVQKMDINKNHAEKLRQYHGVSLGVWKTQLFAFGGVPKNPNDNIQSSCFFQLDHNKALLFRNYMIVRLVREGLGLGFLPQFTVSAPETHSVLGQYRLFFLAFKTPTQKFEFQTYKISKDENKNIVLSNIEQKMSLNLKNVQDEWVKSGFLEDQSYCMLNSLIERQLLEDA